MTPYEVIQDGATIGIVVMTPEQKAGRQRKHPKTTYLPMLGLWLNPTER